MSGCLCHCATGPSSEAEACRLTCKFLCSEGCLTPIQKIPVTARSAEATSVNSLAKW